MSVGVEQARPGRVVLAVSPSTGAAGGAGAAAIVATAPAERVGGHRAVPVSVALRVGLGAAEALRVGH
jgi:hypothetical protein